MKRVKVFNETNHIHAVRLLQDNGTYGHKKLAGKKNGRKSFAPLTEEQFLDLYMNSRDFSSGFLSFDEKDLTDDIKINLGLPMTEEESKDFIPEFKTYSDEDILKLVKAKGKKGNEEFEDFAEEINNLEIVESAELKNRIFVVSKSVIEDLSKKRADAIEALTGNNFVANEILENETK